LLPLFGVTKVSPSSVSVKAGRRADLKSNWTAEAGSTMADMLAQDDVIALHAAGRKPRGVAGDFAAAYALSDGLGFGGRVFGAVHGERA
jgi:hypothetical protein